MPVPFHDPFLYPPPSSQSSTKNNSNNWGPYSGAGDFSTNMVIVLVVLFGALILALALNAIIRFLLCRRRSPPPPSDDPEKQKTRKEASPVETLPTLVYSAGMKLSGAEAECAICLSEFAEGDGVRVLPVCKHGFHVKCIEEWLASHSSCPTCRSSCRTAGVSPEKSGVVEA